MVGSNRSQDEGDDGLGDVVGVRLGGDRRERAGERLGDAADDDGREQVGVVVGGNLAGGDGEGQEVGHLVAIEPAVGQALGVDQRVHGLVDERPGQAAVGQRGGRVGLDDRGQPLRVRARLVPGGVHRGQLVLGVRAEDLDEQLGLGREVPVQRPGRDAGALAIAATDAAA